MDDVHEAVFLEELASNAEHSLRVGHKVHVVGVLSTFPLFQRFGILSLDGERLIVDFDLVNFDFSFLECHLYHALGELRLISEVSNFPMDVVTSASCMYLKVRFVRSAGGLDVKLYKRSVLERRKFLEERKIAQRKS